MNQNIIFRTKHFLITVFSCFIFCQLQAQTDLDAIMMNKKQLCTGLMYNHSAWDYYWEGTLKRNNLNLGTVSTQSTMGGVNYGITNKLNVMISAPYVWTKSSAGTLHGSRGLQDVSFFVKWKPVTLSFKQNKISLYLIGGFSTPLTNYQVDYLPLTLGIGSTNIISRGMIDFKHQRFTVTASATYIWRSNVEIDRTSYYDTRPHLTNQVKMPDASQYQLRTGYRGRYLIAEALLTNWTTLGGFDITRNNMPFPSNRMNITTVGGNFKYTLKSYTHLSFLAGANYTVAGRNVGKATAYNAGAFYAFYVNKSTRKNINN
ncbi:MAG: hypothetical protein ABI358_07295 [Ginsengibacter sp.]